MLFRSKLKFKTAPTALSHFAAWVITRQIVIPLQRTLKTVERIACKLLDLKTCQCTDYPNRRDSVPDCIQLTPGQADQFKWLPPTCGYRLVSERKDLPLWHHLVCGDRDAVHHERISQSGRMLAEGSVPEDDWEDYLIFRAG